MNKLVVKGLRDHVVATGKCHQSWIFTFRVTSVVKGEYIDDSVECELYQGQGGEELLVALGCGNDGWMNLSTADLNRQTEFVLALKRVPQRTFYPKHSLLVS